MQVVPVAAVIGGDVAQRAQGHHHDRGWDLPADGGALLRDMLDESLDVQRSDELHQARVGHLDLRDRLVVAEVGGGEQEDIAPALGLGTLLYESVSVMPHYDAFVRGLIDFKSVLYFVLMSGMFLYANALVLERNRE